MKRNNFYQFHFFFLIAMKIGVFITPLPVLYKCVFLLLLTKLSLLPVNLNMYSLIILQRKMNYEQIQQKM